MKRSTRTKKITISFGSFGRFEVQYKAPKLTKKQRAQRNLRARLAIFIIVALVSTIFFGTRAYGELSPKQVTPVPVKQEKVSTQTTPLHYAQPTQLSIEAIGVKSQITNTTLDTTGSIAVPNQDNTVGWYEQNVSPGQTGTSIIVGHLDNANGPAVFWNLAKLSPGQTIAITRQDGSIARFTVTEIGQYTANNYPTQKVYGPSNQPELRLITCGGAYNVFTGHYEANTVVFAKLTN